MYNFLKFCGKLFTWTKYIYDQLIIYLRKRQGYDILRNDDLESQNQTHGQQRSSLYKRCKTYTYNTFNYYYKRLFGRSYKSTSTSTSTHVNIPLTETISTSVQTNIKNESYYKSEQDYFNNKLDSLNNSSMMFNNKYSGIDSNINSEMDPNLFHSEMDKNLFNNVTDKSKYSDNNNSNMFESVDLESRKNSYYDINFSTVSNLTKNIREPYPNQLSTERIPLLSDEESS